jgi:hypothetical protein
MKSMRKIVSYGGLMLAVAAGAALLWRHEQVADWFALHGYTPPSAIARLSRDDTMTSSAQHLFYVNRPLLESRDGFNQHCKNETEQTVVLGCYHGDRQGIYLYSVTDSRLHGVEQTTAAHEMLHQAYERLSAKDRKHIGGLLQDYYKNHLSDDAVKSQIEAYKKAEPDALEDEMHSLFGTEIAHLPAPLENYYKRYFTDRSKVVAFNASYQSEFTKRRAQVTQYDQQLTSLKTRIDTQEKDLDTRQNAIRTKKSQLDQEAAANRIDLYNADVTAYNAMAQAYNRELASTRSLIDQYNGLIEQRNAIAVQEQQLQQALDSRLTPVGRPMIQ